MGIKNYILLLIIFTASCQSINAQRKTDIFTDTLDNAFDISKWLMQKEGFLPVPMIITEPAVGYGGMMSVMFFHSSFMKRKGPPDISGAVGGGTTNGTWGLGGFHAGFYKNDHIRYVGAFFKLNINIKFYGQGLIFDDGINLNMNSWLLFQQLKFRVKESNFFIGGKYLLYNTQNSFEIPINIPDYTGKEFKANLSELSLLLNYESRNNIFTPTDGIFAQISSTYSDKWFGGVDTYGRISSSLLGFIPTKNKFVIGLRFETTNSIGDVPFWARPVVFMRGVPVMKYQDNQTSVMETELSYNIYRRWYLIGFTGMGNAYSDFKEFGDGKFVRNIGTGFRYKIARLFGLQMGMDFAWSNEDFGFYFIVGHAWMR